MLTPFILITSTFAHFFVKKECYSLGVSNYTQTFAFIYLLLSKIIMSSIETAIEKLGVNSVYFA